jgi:hypothetical protein
MKRYVTVQIPTKYADVKPYYVKEENTIYIVGWNSEDLKAGAQALATVKIAATPILEWYNTEAASDGLAQAIVILVLDSIEEGSYEQWDKAESCVDVEG